jgi:hypothetical protein
MPEPPAHLGFLWRLLPWLLLDLPLLQELVAAPRSQLLAAPLVLQQVSVLGSELKSERRHKTEPLPPQTRCRLPGQAARGEVLGVGTG